MKNVTCADMLFTLMHGKNQIKTMEKVACALMLFSGEKKLEDWSFCNIFSGA